MVMGWGLIRAAETIKLALQRRGVKMKVACWMLLLLLLLLHDVLPAFTRTRIGALTLKRLQQVPTHIVTSLTM
jgi:hypothetical protein